jgi:hypothetical protein
MPTKFVVSRSASPSNKFSVTGILTDLFFLKTRLPNLRQSILDYLSYARLDSEVEGSFELMLEQGTDIITELKKFDSIEMTGVQSGLVFLQHDHLITKTSIRNHGLGPGEGLSQFATKEEAAGKIRLFALMDAVSQSTLSPLHEALFALLRKIPNDGTFDQEASIKRSQDKAIKANCAYSFDLSSATDRLPA